MQGLFVVVCCRLFRFQGCWALSMFTAESTKVTFALSHWRRCTAMGSSTAVKVALLATCLLLQHTLAQRSGGAMVGSGSGSSESAGYGRGGRAGRGGSSDSSDSSDSNTMAMTLGGGLSCFCAFMTSACSAH